LLEKSSVGKGVIISSLTQFKKRIKRKLKLASFLFQCFIKKFIHIIKPRLPKVQKAYAQHFPAVTLRTDGFSHFFNFSTELVVIGLVIAVAGFNTIAFGHIFGIGQIQGDESLAGKLLEHNNDWNPELYAHNNSIKTVVLGSNGIIPKAYAQNVDATGAETIAGEDETNNEDDVSLSFNIEDNALVKPNTGRVKGLVNIQVYTTQVGDTLSTIAEKYNISTNTIKWANNLPSDSIKPGWYLKIPPVDGILLVIGSNTSGPDVAYKYGANLKKIIAYNGLEGPLDFEPGDVIMVPDGKMPTPAAPIKPKAAPKGTAVVKEKLAPSKGHIFVAGQCTDYVARKKYIPWGGHAKHWIANSKAYGAVVDKNPEVGQIIVTSESRYGHVAFIESVSGDMVTFSEWNYRKPFEKTVRTLNVNSSAVKGIIHY
jgi:surface antigen/LysM repeat protein